MTDLLDLLHEMDAPIWGECGHKRTHEGSAAHAVECLKLVCPHCGLTVPNSYFMMMEHDPFGDHWKRWGTCSPQRWQFERVACCMACRWPTFGQWPCRNEACELHVCDVGCEQRRGRPGYLDRHPDTPSRPER